MNRSSAIAAGPHMPVPMSGPDIGPAEVNAVIGTLSSGCLSLGSRLEEFECRMAAFTGVRHAIAVSSGTAGLHLAVIAAGVSDGDLVITTPFSFVASANCMLYERAIPVFVDVDPITGNIDPERVAEAAADLVAGGARRQRWLPPSVSAAGTKQLKAILPVHAFGQPAAMDPILDVARAHGLVVIEDACEAVGAGYNHRRVGTLGDAGVFAFYPNKQMTTGEGGMLVTDRDDWAFQFRSLRNQGRDAMTGWLHHDRLGYNYRLDELSAALGAVQLARIETLLTARERVAGWYNRRLSALRDVLTPVIVPATTRMSWFAYVVRLGPGVDRQTVMDGLAARGIPSRPYFVPIHLQPFYAQRFGYTSGSFPVTEALGATSLALPFSGTLIESEVARVCDVLAALAIPSDRRADTVRATA